MKMSTMGDMYVRTMQCKRTNHNRLFLCFSTIMIVQHNYDYKTLTFSAHYRS